MLVTQLRMKHQLCSSRPTARYSVYLLSQYKSAKTDAAARATLADVDDSKDLSFSEWQRAFADEVLTLLASLVHKCKY